MSEREDTNDAWWHAQESDERWQRHMLRAELKGIVDENAAKTKKYATKAPVHVNDQAE